VKPLILGLRFLCEIAALVAVAWWGWTVTPVLGIVLPVAAASAWGAWIAPRASRRLADPARFALELVIFAAATASLLAVGQPVMVVVFAVAAVVTAALTRRWPEPTGPRGTSPVSDTGEEE
jgi:hypothetical protein